jgi:hypothetical protein
MLDSHFHRRTQDGENLRAIRSKFLHMHQYRVGGQVCNFIRGFGSDGFSICPSNLSKIEADDYFPVHELDLPNELDTASSSS